MSRHREVRNMDVQGELAEDDYEEEEEEGAGMTTEQREQMDDALDRVREILGPDSESGLSKRMIEDSLWEYYFDVEKTVNWLIQQQERSKAQQERKGDKDLPPLPGQPGQYDYGEGSSRSSSSSGAGSALQRLSQARAGLGAVYGRTNVPLIHLAQGDYPPEDRPPDDEYYEDYEESDVMTPVSRLTTITEKTEQSTVGSSIWKSPRPATPPLLSPQIYEIHPPVVRGPPSPQMWERRSQYSDNVPVARPLSSTTSTTTDYGTVIEGTLMRHPTDPNDIPPSPTPSALQRLSIYEPPPSAAPSESATPPATPPPPIESLPDIPDDRSRSTRPRMPPPAPATLAPPVPPKQSKLQSKLSTRASTVSQSSRTYTIDDDASVVTYPALRPSARSMASFKSVLPTVPASSDSGSVTSSVVRRAIETAMKGEGKGKHTREVSTSSNSTGSSQSTIKATSPVTPTTATSDVRKPSKLAMLAQAKAAQQQGHWMPTPKSRTTSGSTPTGLHKPKTEYLTAVANGPTATTAITTSYQSLSSLIPPSRVVPTTMVPMRASALTSGKASKLALKSRKLQPEPEPEPEMETEPKPEPLPIFFPKSPRSRASPSAFASLLVDAPDHHEGTGPSSRRALYPPPPEHILASPSRFAFEGPSPDDVVFSARRGTALASAPRRVSAKSGP